MHDEEFRFLIKLCWVLHLHTVCWVSVCFSEEHMALQRSMKLYPVKSVCVNNNTLSR